MRTPESGKDTNVLSKTPEEIKKGLQCHANNEYCKDGCPYLPSNHFGLITGVFECTSAILNDALAYIKQLERERDAAVEDIPRECHKCKHFKVLFNGCKPDYDCDLSDVCKDNDKWEWRGVKEVEG